MLIYVIYEFLKKVSGGPRPTCLVRVHCALSRPLPGEIGTNKKSGDNGPRGLKGNFTTCIVLKGTISF